MINLNENKNVSLRCVGRLKHNSFMSKGKLVSKTTFTLLKRKSSLSLQDMVCDPDNDDIELLELGSYEEGIYEIVTTNPSYDWETGVLDNWELKLIPYKEGEVG